MEQFVLGFFQEQLSKVIVGFRKEQINANILNGKGEITNVTLNCAVINEALRKVSPFLEFEEIHVDRLGFHVTAWANLRKAPIVVDIGVVRAVIHEPLQCLPRNQRRKVKIVTERDLVQLLLQGLYKPLRGNSSYGFGDRIVDNLTIEIEKLQLCYQTWGKFKTRRIGPWTPPTFQIEIDHLKLVAVDQYGHEASPDQVWEHNRLGMQEFMLYKKLSGTLRVKLMEAATQTTVVLIQKLQFENQVAIKRRLRDGAVLGIQVDVTIPSIHMEIEAKDIPILTHWVAALQYCFSKDRSFEDPLRAETSHPGPLLQESQEDNDAEENAEDDEEEVEGNDEDDDDSLDGKPTETTAIPFDDDNDSKDDRPAIAQLTQSASSDAPYKERPLILLPNGLVIYENVCFTCSVHDIILRGVYANGLNGYIQLSTKGCISELIWPKADNQSGFYLQMSVSFVSIQERLNRRVQTLMIGGVAHGDHLSIHQPSKKPHEVHADENFPLFERRSIREDPLDLRHTFPSQAFGTKTTVDIVPGIEENDQPPMVLHEIGVDEFDVVLDADAWCRALCFFLNEEGGGFDPRWHTGDWTDLLTQDMLKDPKAELQLHEHTQTAKQILLDENAMISSDRFNVTARFSNIELRVPAAITENVRSCDILMQIGEATLVISSALPRTFLSGKIGNSISGDGLRVKGTIDFPNDPSDIAYSLEKTEDPSLRLSGVKLSRNVSTFRVQLGVRAFQIKIVPIIPFCDAPETQQLIAPMAMTMITCFEGEPPSDGSNSIKIALFLSMHVHAFRLNIDFDLLAGATSSILHNYDVLQSSMTKIIALLPAAPTQSDDMSTVTNDTIPPKLKKGMKGRRVLVRRQFTKSRETGGLGMVICLQVSECAITIWRQNVPYTSPLRHPSHTDSTEASAPHRHVRLLKLIDTQLKELEFGIEFDFQSDHSRRIVVKCCLEEGRVLVCNVSKSMGNEESNSILTAQDLTTVVNSKNTESTTWNMVELVTFGMEKLPGKLNSSYSGENYHLAMRLEEQVKMGSRSWSLSADLNCPTTVNACVEEVKDTIILIMEALLLPTWSKREFPVIAGAPFPPKSVGAMFHSLIPRSETAATSGDVTWDLLPDKGPNPSSDAIVERALKLVFKLFLPADLHLVLLRLEIANLLLSIPDDAQESHHRSLGMHLMQTDLIVRFYPRPGTQPSQMEDVLACKGVAWSSLINTPEEGYYQRITSRQSLLSISLRDKNVHVEELVHPFHIGLTYAAAKLHLAMDEDLKVNDIRRIESFVEGMKKLQERSTRYRKELSSFLAAIKQPVQDNVENMIEDGRPLHVFTVPSSIHQVNHANINAHVLRTRIMLNRVQAELGEYEKEVRTAISRQTEQVAQLQRKIFEVERSRFAAVALMSSRVAGWIRTGGVHRTGQRVARKSTLWPSWAVLRKNLLILYSCPGDPKPSDIVLLEGAKIRQLAGGRSKQDVKRGFAIIESGGMTRYFVASGMQEFSRWISEISEVIDMYKTESSTRDDDNVPSLPRFDEVTNQYRAMDADAADLSSHPSECEVASQDGEGENSGRARRLGGRLAGAKTRLGAALETARQKGKELSERRREATLAPELSNLKAIQGEDMDEAFSKSVEDDQMDLPTEEAESSNSPEVNESTSGPSDPSGSDDASGVGRRRLQFGKAFTGMTQATKSKFGTAIQNARQKGALQTPPRPLSAFRAKPPGLSSAPSDIGDRSAGNRSAASSYDEPGGPNSVPGSFWTCKACTFVNSRQYQAIEKSTCQMCGTIESPPEDEGITSAAVDTSASVECTQTNLPIATGPIDESKSGFPDDGSRRSRFGAIGAAVRTVRQNSLDDASESGQDRGRGVSSRFNFRKRRPESSMDLLFDDTAITLNRVHASGIAPLAHEVASPKVPLKVLEGKWMVSVKPRIEGVCDSLKASQSSDSLLAESCDSETNISLNGSVTYDQSDATRDAGIKTSTEVFIISTRRSDMVNATVKETPCTFGAIMQLHSAVSEGVGDILPQLSFEHFNRNKALLSGSSQDTYDLVEHVLLTGRMLGGFFDQGLTQENLSKSRDYQAEIIEWFLNSLLQCPLPIETLMEIAELLEISASTKSVAQSALDSPTSRDLPKETVEGKRCVDVNTDPSRDRPQQIFSLLAACNTEMLRAETFESNNEPIIDSTVVDSTRSNGQVHPHVKTQIYDPLLPPSVSDRMQEAMHEALVNAMAERDEAHSQLIASNVLHVHELEQERRRNERLMIEKDLKEERARLQQPNVASFFQNLNDDRSRRNLEAKLTNFERMLRKNNDMELAEATRQLAEEVSAKTSHALELVRMKEAREIERKNDAEEKDALKEELRRVKALLAAYESKHEAHSNGSHVK